MIKLSQYWTFKLTQSLWEDLANRRNRSLDVIANTITDIGHQVNGKNCHIYVQNRNDVGSLIGAMRNLRIAPPVLARS